VPLVRYDNGDVICGHFWHVGNIYSMKRETLAFAASDIGEMFIAICNVT
jgi:hypothetical protein